MAVLAAALIAIAVPASAQGQGDGARQGRDGGAPAGGGRQGGGPGGGGAGGRQGGGPPAAPPAIKQVTAGVYMVTGLGGNTTVRVDPAGLIIVDTKNLGEANYNQLMDLVKTVSQAPVKYVFVTHHHQDHSGNIGSFQKAGVPVIVQVNLNKDLETYNPQQGKPEMAKITYTKDKKVKVGKAKAEAHYFGRGHTNGDTFVWFPDVKVVSAGDMITGTAPNSDMAFGGSVVEWVSSLDKVLKLPFTGDLGGRRDALPPLPLAALLRLEKAAADEIRPLGRAAALAALLACSPAVNVDPYRRERLETVLLALLDRLAAPSLATLRFTLGGGFWSILDEKWKESTNTAS